MKKTVAFFVCCLWGLLCYAQQEDRQNNQNHTDSIQPEEHDVRTYEMWKHKKYFRVGYVNQSVTSASGSDMQSRFGIDLLKGRSFFLHKKPIAGLMKFAIDFGVYLNYTMYRDDVATTESGGSDGYQEGEQAGETTEDGGSDGMMGFFSKNYPPQSFDFGLMLGPSLTINPVADLRIAAYWHVMPAGSMFLKNSNMGAGFIPYMNYGLELTYRWIGLGVERKYGNGNLWSINNMIENGGESTPIKYRTAGYSLYLAFRF